MADDTLRLKAEVTDGFSAPLRRLNGLLSETARHPAGKWLRNEWGGVRESFDRITAGLNTGLNPALSRIGVTSFGAAGGIAAIGAAVKSFASQTQSLGILSRELGLSTKQLREMRAMSEHFGMSWDTAQGSLKRFQDNLGQIRRNWGETYGALRGMNLGDLAKDLQSAPDMQSAVDRALEGIKGIANPSYRRKVAELLFGSDQWATIAKELDPRLRREIQKMLSDLPAGSEEAAQKFNLGLGKMAIGLEELRNQAIAPLMGDINGLVGTLSKPESLAVFQREIKGVTDGVQAFRKEVGHLKEAWDAITNLDVGGAFRALRQAEGASGPLARKLAPLPGDEAADRSGRITELEAKLKDAEERRAHNDRYLPGRVPERQQELTRQIEELTKEMKRLREDQGLIQKQSFDGMGGIGLGGMIHRAGLGDVSGIQRFNRSIARPPGMSGDSFTPWNGQGTLRGYDSQGRPIIGGSGVPRVSPRGAEVARGPRSLFPESPATIGIGEIPGLPGSATDQYANILGKRESGNRYGIRNPYGFTGRWQMGAAALADTGYVRRGTSNRGLVNSDAWLGKRGISSLHDFLSNKEGIQDRQFREYTAMNHRTLTRMGVIRPGMSAEQVAGYLAAAHLGGPGSARKLAQGGGDFADANGTRVSSYYAMMRGVRSDSSSASAATPSRPGDSMMARSFGPNGVSAGAPKMEATGNVNITLGPGLEKMPARVSMDGLFKDVQVSRGRQMEAAN